MADQCAYIHCKPDFTVFYVGKGRVKRAHKLGAYERNIYHKNIVSKYGAKNIKIGVIPCSTENTAFELEKGLIKCFRRMGVKLTNMTDGGEGKTGCPNPPEAYISSSKKQKNKFVSKDTKAKISASKVGHSVSKETRQKLSIIFKERKVSEGLLLGQRKGGDNPKAISVIGYHIEYGEKEFATQTEAAQYINSTSSKVSRALKRGIRTRGWSFVLNKESL
jgi:hypothetical protein